MGEEPLYPVGPYGGPMGVAVSYERGTPVGPYGGPRGGGLFLMSEVPLCWRFPCRCASLLLSEVTMDVHCASSSLLSSLELSDTKVYEP